jgi:uncharacterized RDD family membrane protein YckC
VPDEAIQIPPGLTTAGLLGRRYFARFIDTVFIGMLIAAFLAIERIVLPPIAGGAANILFTLVNLILLLGFWIGYGTAFESSLWQATPGKRFLGLRVYNSQAGRLTLRQAAGRNLLKDGPFLLFGFIPGSQLLVLIWLGAHIIVMHRSPVYQAIHDRAFRTLVAAPEETIQLHLS